MRFKKEVKRRMNKYTVCYVDGHNLKYKTFETEAENINQAIENMEKQYEGKGDFDHLICDILINEDSAETMCVVLDQGAAMPVREHQTDAGLDLRCIKGGVILPFSSKTFDTGVHLELPQGTWGKIESKSGLNVKHGIVSCGGTIDEGYTGSIRVKLYNLSWRPYRFHDGDKIAQLVIQNYIAPDLVLVESLEETDRGNNGFGSTGR